jgi:hypothetical protein
METDPVFETLCFEFLITQECHTPSSEPFRMYQQFSSRASQLADVLTTNTDRMVGASERITLLVVITALNESETDFLCMRSCSEDAIALHCSLRLNSYDETFCLHELMGLSQ